MKTSVMITLEYDSEDEHFGKEAVERIVHADQAWSCLYEIQQTIDKKLYANCKQRLKGINDLINDTRLDEVWT